MSEKIDSEPLPASQPSTAASAAESSFAAGRVTSPSKQILRRFFRHRLAVIGFVVFSIICLMALFAPIIAPYSPNEIDLRGRNLGPSWQHLFGTDRTGRDTFSRVVYAGRVSLSVGLAAVVISVSVGALLGAVAGYFGGKIDSLIMRFTDVIMTFPSVIIILTVAAIAGPGIYKTILVIGLLNWPIPCRLVRAKFLAFRARICPGRSGAWRAPGPGDSPPPCCRMRLTFSSSTRRSVSPTRFCLKRVFRFSAQGSSLPPQAGATFERGQKCEHSRRVSVAMAAGRCGRRVDRAVGQFHWRWT